ncbi:MAG: SUMF1/EgtB/PvdO family nonheme iron enzyme, partial [Candidatus Acidiferrales bacterium]
MSSLPAIETEEALRVSLRARLAQGRRRTDELFALLRPPALYDRPIPEWHRIVFYLGHYEIFDWNLICRDAAGQDSAQPEFDELFRIGFPAANDRRTDPPGDWPSEDVIRRANQRWRADVDACLDTVSFFSPPHPYFRQGYAFQYAIEHRLMHAETLTYKLHCLPLESMIPPPHKLELSAPVVKRRQIAIPAGRATLGLERAENNVFGWDNEYEGHTVDVPAFAIDSHNVTNADFLAFVRVGGYRERSLWSEADWTWKEAQGLEHPLFWVRCGDAWHYRTLFEEIPLPLAWPVFVTQAEAAAYARWAGKSLPSEAQFHRAAYGTRDGRERLFPWGDEWPAAQHGNFDFQHWAPVPVGSHPAGTSAFGVADLVG